MIVPDASAVLEIVLGTLISTSVESKLLDPGETLHAPHLIDAEVAQVVRRYSLTREIDENRGRDALRTMSRLPINRYPHDFLFERVWDLRNNLTAYDAIYVALAEVLDATLVTRDSRLARAAGHRARIEVI